jgi:hypothetical protein
MHDQLHRERNGMSYNRQQGAVATRDQGRKGSAVRDEQGAMTESKGMFGYSPPGSRWSRSLGGVTRNQIF